MLCGGDGLCRASTTTREHLPPRLSPFRWWMRRSCSSRPQSRWRPMTLRWMTGHSRWVGA